MSDRCQISPRARLTLSRLTREEWLLVSRMVDEICANPAVDNIRTFTVYRPPLVYRMFYEPPFAIFFRQLRPTEIAITSIRPADSVPPISEWDSWLNG